MLQEFLLDLTLLHALKLVTIPLRPWRRLTGSSFDYVCLLYAKVHSLSKSWKSLAFFMPVILICSQLVFLFLYYLSESEKARRWQEIKIRQHRLLTETEQSTPAHLEQIMKSGFSLSDIKGYKSLSLFSSLKLFQAVM